MHNKVGNKTDYTVLQKKYTGGRPQLLVDDQILNQLNYINHINVFASIYLTLISAAII